MKAIKRPRRAAIAEVCRGPQGTDQVFVGLDQLAVAHVEVDSMDVLDVREMDGACQGHDDVAHLPGRRANAAVSAGFPAA